MGEFYEEKERQAAEAAFTTAVRDALKNGQLSREELYRIVDRVTSEQTAPVHIAQTRLEVADTRPEQRSSLVDERKFVSDWNTALKGGDDAVEGFSMPGYERILVNKGAYLFIPPTKEGTAYILPRNYTFWKLSHFFEIKNNNIDGLVTQVDRPFSVEWNSDMSRQIEEIGDDSKRKQEYFERVIASTGKKGRVQVE